MSALAILLLDDDPADLMLLSETVEQAFPGARVHKELDAGAVGELCEAEQFNCVLLDYNMPGIDGLACAQKLRASFPFLPIVLHTGVGDEMLAAHALQSGVTDYIPKGRITSDSLRRIVDHAIRVTDQARIIEEQRSELENFAFALAHDFKQPIRQIRTFSTLVSEAIREGRTEGVDKHLNFLDDAARRLGSLVDVMSEYTLLNKPPLIEDVDLNLAMEGARASLGPYLEERGGHLTAAQLPLVRGNQALMTQVLQNIIVNGIKYNTSNTPSVSIKCSSDNGNCTITVKDNGIGIEHEYIDEIFKPLIRLHTSAEYAGSGLGLTLARKAITTQGGALWCKSEPGAGSTFFIRIPLSAAA